MSAFKDRTGQIVGFLKVLERAPSIKGRTAWLVLCTRCGKTKVLASRDLNGKRVLSCGCYGHDANTQRLIHLAKTLNPLRARDWTGQMIGFLKVLQRVGSIGGYPAWLVLCTRCGRQKVVKSQYLYNKKTVSCGCYRIDLAKRRIPYLTQLNTLRAIERLGKDDTHE